MAQLSELEQQEQNIQNMLNNLNIEISNIENNLQESENQEVVAPAPRMRLSPYSGEMVRLCDHVFSRGPRQGQFCPDRVCINNDTLCRTHHNAQRRRERRQREREQRRNAPLLPQLIRLPHVRNEIIEVEALPEIVLPPLPQFEELLRERGARGARRRNNRLFLQSEEEKEEINELIYKSCSMCNSKVEGAKVTLECGCQFHLNCYLLVQQEPNCLTCGDKINKTEDDYEDCSICLEKLKSGKVKTNCGHSFHKDCINSWIRIGRGHNTDKCPNCRGNMR